LGDGFGSAIVPIEKCRFWGEDARMFSEILVEFQTDPNVVAVVLLGSAARGEMDAFSDLDVHVVVRGKRPPDRSYYHQDRLVNINFVDTNNRQEMLTDPWRALWNVLPAVQAKILFDPSDWYSKLQAKARAFTWSQVQTAANLEVSRMLAGNAEEVQKVLSGLQSNNLEKTLYATLGLTSGMGSVGALARGALMSTENRYWSTICALEPDLKWQELLWAALGMSAETVVARARAALGLYVKSVELHEACLTAQDAVIATRVLKLIRDTNLN
jgi:predicted nucleotidyltransferase